MLDRRETALTQRLNTRLTPFLEQLVSLIGVPGLAVGVVAGDALVYARGFGVASLADQRPVTERTLFHMASVTKTFAGAAVLQLAETGQLDLDAPVSRYLPYFSLADPRSDGVTARGLLSHTSGMPDTQEFGWEKPEYDDGALERYVRSLSNLTLEADPGARFAYSNIAYEVLGDLVAKLSGATFEERLAQTLLRPLGMQRSTLLVRETDPALLAAGHVLDAQGHIVVSDVFPYNRAHAPSSTLYTNVEELACWAAANINAGTLSGKRILQPETHAAMLQPVAAVNADFHRYIGLSWFLTMFRGERVVQHDGADTGFTSDLVILPDAGLAVFAMANLDFGFAPEIVTRAALGVMLE